MGAAIHFNSMVVACLVGRMKLVFVIPPLLLGALSFSDVKSRTYQTDGFIPKGVLDAANSGFKDSFGASFRIGAAFPGIGFFKLQRLAI